MRKDVIVIGAGASGLICAGEAGKRGRSVLVVDHAPNTGSKIRISGGGKCNVTNLYMSEDNYISRNPHFCKSALSRFTPNDDVLPKINEPRVALVLLEMLKDPEREVKNHVIAAMGELKDARTLPALQEIMAHRGDREMHALAKGSIAKINN